MNNKLLWLGLGSNSIGADGTWALCESLLQNTSLLWIGLGGNELGDKGALHLATLLQSKYNISVVVYCRTQHYRPDFEGSGTGVPMLCQIHD